MNRGEVTPHWVLQLMWFSGGGGGTAAVLYFLSQSNYVAAVWTGIATIGVVLLAVALYLRNGLLQREQPTLSAHPSPAPLSAPDDLGTIVRTFGSNPWGAEGPSWTLVILFGLIGGPLFIGVILLTAIRDGLSSVLTWEFGAAAICAPLWFLVGLGALLDIKARRRDSLTIHRGGFVLRREKESHRWKWEEVEEIRHLAEIRRSGKGVYMQTLHSYSIRSGEGKSTLIDPRISSVLEAGTLIQEEVSPRLLNQAVRSLAAGGKLDYGPFSLSRTHLFYGGEQLPWSKIGEVVIDQMIDRQHLIPARTEIATISIGRASGEVPWGPVPSSDVPNDFILPQLIDKLKRGLDS